jgi:hypothetical protein
MRGGGNGQGGEGKPGRREGGPLQQQEQPLPPSAVEEEPLAKEEQEQPLPPSAVEEEQLAKKEQEQRS